MRQSVRYKFFYGLHLPDDVVTLSKLIYSYGGLCILVGGVVRDIIIGTNRRNVDYDIEVYFLKKSVLQQILVKYYNVSFVGAHFGVFKIHGLSVSIDLSLPRTEVSIGKKHSDFDVSINPFMLFSISSARRDFTINSIGYCIEYSLLLDPFDGLNSIHDRVIECVSDNCFCEDPLRMLRAIYFSSKLSFKIPNNLFELLCKYESSLINVSSERIGAEFYKILCCNYLLNTFYLLSVFNIKLFDFARFLVNFPCLLYVVRKLEAIDGFLNRVMFMFLILGESSKVSLSSLLLFTPFLKKAQLFYFRSAVCIVKSFLRLDRKSFLLFICDFMSSIQRVVIDSVVKYTLDLFDAITAGVTSSVCVGLYDLLGTVVGICYKVLDTVNRIVCLYRDIIPLTSMPAFKIVLRSIALNFYVNKSCSDVMCLPVSQVKHIISLLACT